MVKKISDQDFIDVRQLERASSRSNPVVLERRDSLEGAGVLMQSEVWWMYAWRISSWS
jgi:hypothetical protein